MYPNDYKYYLVPKTPKLIIFIEKLNLVQETTVMNNYVVVQETTLMNDYVVLHVGAAAQKRRQAELSSSIC